MSQYMDSHTLKYLKYILILKKILLKSKITELRECCKMVKNEKSEEGSVWKEVGDEGSKDGGIPNQFKYPVIPLVCVL